MVKRSSSSTKSKSSTKTTIATRKNATAPKKTKKTSPTRSRSVATKTSSRGTAMKKKNSNTRIVIKYDAGYSNDLFLRGEGGSLSWNKGIKMKNIKNDEWLWESEVSFSACEFKVLLNDENFEEGENHALTCGSALRYTPKF